MSFKVAHITFCFRPDPIGGTEVYVEALAKALQTRGVTGIVVAPIISSSSQWEHQGLKVRRFHVNPKTPDMLRELYGIGDPLAAANFASILDEEQPDIVHMHAFTRAVSLRLVREAKLRRIPIIFTYHTPTVSCQRGTLMRWGYEMCDGRLDLKDCTSCVLHRHGLNKTHSKMLSALPPVVGKMLGRARLSGSYWTALRMSELVQLRHSVYRNLISEVDHVVALCQWTEDLLIDHGVPSEKITVSHHGLTQVTGNNYKKLAKPSSGSGKLRIAFMGRLDRTKGVDVIIRALRELPGLKAELDVYGVAQELNGNDYLRKLRLIAADDSRFNFRSPIHSDQAISCLDEYDLLAVPSRTFETGPLVVLEAFAAGIPVIGSNLGGIAELVEHEVNGLLVETDSITEWKSALQRCASEGGLLDRLRAGVRPPRSMATVAGEMMTLYKRLLMAGSRERRPFS